jgi:hypothetical protein
MKNDIITITVERMSNGKRLSVSTMFPESMLDSCFDDPREVVLGEIRPLMAQLDEKEINSKLTLRKP